MICGFVDVGMSVVWMNVSYGNVEYWFDVIDSICVVDDVIDELFVVMFDL